MSTENLTSCLARMMVSGEFSDLKFVCQGDEFKVHKAVVCGQSPVIGAAVKGEFEESRSNIIDMSSFEPDTVVHFIKFLYTGDYDEHQSQQEGHTKSVSGSPHPDGDTQVRAGVNNKHGLVSSEPAPPTADTTASLIHHIHVNCIGYYYAVDALVSLANTKIKALIEVKGENKDWVPGLPLATEIALETTGDEGLMDILASETAENISILVSADNLNNTDVVTDFSHRVFKCCEQEIRRLKARVEQVRDNLQDVEIHSVLEAQNYEKKIKERETEIDEFKLCLETLRVNNSCRNTCCDSLFGCYVAWDERILRCKRCRCKH